MNHKTQNLPDCVMEIMLQWRICQVLSKKYFSPAQPQTLPSTMMEATEPNMLWEGEQKWSRFNNSSGHDLRADVGQQFQGLSNALLSHQMKSHPQLQCTKHGCRTLQMFLQIHTTYIYQVLLSDQALSIIQSLPLWSSRGFISNLATPKFYSNWDMSQQLGWKPLIQSSPLIFLIGNLRTNLRKGISGPAKKHISWDNSAVWKQDELIIQAWVLQFWIHSVINSQTCKTWHLE